MYNEENKREKRVRMKTIHIPCMGTENATPAVVAALESLRGETDVALVFEKGEYHFWSEGSVSRFLGVANNDSGVKSIVFPIFDFNGLTVDGCGATFIFHDLAFPVAVSHSQNVTLKNIIFDRSASPVIAFRVCNICEDGFDLLFDKAQNPFRIERGGLVFERVRGDVSNLEREFYLHRRIERGHCVQFLITGDANVSTDHFPVPYSWMDATEIDGGVHLVHRVEHPHVCRYDEGEEVLFVADCEREVDVIFLGNSENVKLQNITIRRGCGMGVIGQLCHNIELDGVRTDVAYHNEASSVTLDALHFVNCSGALDIHDCEISYPMDDVLNVHGIYTELVSLDEKRVQVRLVHHQQHFVNPYKSGDVLEMIAPDTREIVAKYRVRTATLSEEGTLIDLTGEFLDGADAVGAGFLVENPDRMPRLHLHDNHFYAYPNIRASGRGGILIENNRLEDYSGTQLVDLSDFWFESGRIGEAVIRGNVFRNCVGRRGIAITVGVSGVDDAIAPKLHGRVEITQNTFDGFSTLAVSAGGVRELIVENNRYVTENGHALRLDGQIPS